MKAAPTYQKLRGGYYTPKPTADFLARWAIRTSTAEVLEPSCGDGVFLEAAAEALSSCGAKKGEIANLVHGVEVDAREAGKSVKRLRSLDVNCSTRCSPKDEVSMPWSAILLLSASKTSRKSTDPWP